MSETYVRLADVVEALRIGLYAGQLDDMVKDVRALATVDLAERDAAWREYAEVLRREGISVYSPFADDLSDRLGEAALSAARAKLAALGVDVDG